MALIKCHYVTIRWQQIVQWRGEDANTSKNIGVSRKHVLARKHCKREDIFKKIKRPSHKYGKYEAKFPLDLDKICAYISDKWYYYVKTFLSVCSVFIIQ